MHRRTAACQPSSLPCDTRLQGALPTPARWPCQPEFAVSLAPAIPERCAAPDGTCQHQNVMDILLKITGPMLNTYRIGY